MLTSPTPRRKPALPISLPTSWTSLASDLSVPLRMFGLGILPVDFPRDSTREPSARPPMTPAAAAVPTSAGTFALRVALATVAPTPLSAAVTPLPDCGLVDLRGRERRDLPAADDMRVGLRVRTCAGDWAPGVRLEDALRLRAGALPLRLVDPDRRAARRVVVWAISTPPPSGCYLPAVG